MRAIVIVPATALLLLAACDKPDNAPGPGGVTMGEARALDRAAAMIDKQRPPADLLVPSDAQAPADGASAASPQSN